MGIFYANGSDVLSQPNVNSNSSGGNDSAGVIKVSGGSQPFPDDYIICFETQNETANNELDGGSSFIGVTVFASQADFDNNIPLYTYEPQNPGQSASIQDSVDGIGDEYVRFNANVLVSSDAGAPAFSSLFVAPGSDVASTATGGQSVVFNHHTDIDFNDDGTIDPTPIEDGNGLFALASGIDPSGPSLPCMLPGTLITTPSGLRRIEDLRVGDQILTAEGKSAEIILVSENTRAPLNSHLPVRIQGGIFGPNQPLDLSPNHGVEMDVKLHATAPWQRTYLRADTLLGQLGVTRWRPQKHLVTYLNIMCAQQHTMLANGVRVETMLPMQDFLPAGPLPLEFNPQRRHKAILPIARARLTQGLPVASHMQVRLPVRDGCVINPIAVNDVAASYLTFKNIRHKAQKQAKRTAAFI